MRPGSKEWTADEEATLVTLRKSGMPMAEIAKQLGRSFDSVASKGNNLRHLIEDQTARVIPVRTWRGSRGETMTAMIMGDPPSGRSALDQRAGQ